MARLPYAPGPRHTARRGPPGRRQRRGGGLGPGADWLLAHLPDLLGESDDPAQLTARHRIVHEARRRHPGVRLARTGLVLESLIPSVLEQKVTSDEAYRAWRLLLQRHGEPAPAPGSGCG